MTDHFDEDEEFMWVLRLDPNFPIDDVQKIANSLLEQGGLVPGYIPPAVGLLDIQGLEYAKTVKGTQIVFFPDRNIVSRVTKIAKSGVVKTFDKPTKMAANLMAFAQAMDILIEPSIALHEFAHRNGNDEAHKELSWFRAADFGQAEAWIDIALGHSTELPIRIPAPKKTDDLAYPLNRWKRNYLVTLKISELELTPMKHEQRVVELIKWMDEDYFMAGPAAIFSTMYFSPHTSRKGLIKSLRSKNRSRAIEGIKNASWDITYLSQLTELVKNTDTSNWYIFATADEKMAQLAGAIFTESNDDSSFVSETANVLSQWWPEQKAYDLTNFIFDNFKKNSYARRSIPNDSLDKMIVEAEQKVLNFIPHQ